MMEIYLFIDISGYRAASLVSERGSHDCTQAILKRIAKSSWEPLVRFYRQNYHIIESIGPRSDQNEVKLQGAP